MSGFPMLPIGQTLAADITDPSKLDERGFPLLIAGKGDVITVAILHAIEDAGLESISTVNGVWTLSDGSANQ